MPSPPSTPPPRPFPAWSDTTPYQRAAILEKTAALIKSRAAEFAEITTAESGKPLDQAKGEWLSAPNYFLWAAEEAKRIYGRVIPSRVANRRIDVTYRPVGVVGTHHRLELPGLQPDPGDQLGAGGRMHDRLPTQRIHAPVGDVDHVVPRGGRAPGRGRQSRQR